MTIHYNDLNHIKHIHFIGISGISMCSLSKYTFENFSHIKITGNTNQNNFFINNHISINEPIENFIHLIDICVYSASISINHEEFQKIINFNKNAKKQIIILKRSEYLNLITSNQERICVLGAHGKTSISTYIYEILESLNPTGFIGANLPYCNNNTLGNKNTNLYIVENDESQKDFLNLISEYTIIPNIGDDHLENYNNSQEEYFHYFKTYFELVKNKNKKIIYNKNNEYGHSKSNFENILDNLVINSKLDAISYGYKNSDVLIKTIINKDILQWSLHTTLKELDCLNNQIFTVSMIGIWNIYNITGALIMGALKKVPILNNLKLYKPARRLEKIYESPYQIILDDYAVHPFEIENIMNACENIYENIIYIWEPHRINRIKFFQEYFKKIFLNKNLYFTDIYEVNHLESSNPKNYIFNGIYIENNEFLKELINNLLLKKEKITIILLNAGNLSEKIKAILSQLDFNH